MGIVFPLNEPIIAAIKLRLETELVTYINALNSEITDGFTLDTFVQILDYPPPITHLDQFPTLGIQDGETGFADDTGWGATGTSLVTVVAFEQDADQQRLAWKLRRWNRVIASCLLVGRSLPPDGWGVVLNNISPGPTLGRQEDPRTFMSFSAVTIAVRSEQDTP